MRDVVEGVESKHSEVETLDMTLELIGGFATFGCSTRGVGGS